MPTNFLRPTRATLQGHFSASLPPCLTVASGDTVVAETLDAAWRFADPERGDFGPLDPILDAGHALLGPIAVEGLRAGETLEIRIDALTVARQGWTVAGAWPHPVNDRLGLSRAHGHRLDWTLDSAAGTGTDQYGRTVRLNPFLGVMGMPPAAPGVHSTVPPRPTGGNLDGKELVAGSTLFLPVAVDGGLLSFGDGHARQGDGEVGVTAIECAMERVELTLIRRTDLSIRAPIAKTADAWIAFGLHEDLNEAMFLALEALVDLMVRVHPVRSRSDALALASVAADLRITQIVNEVRGVHAVLADDAIVFPGAML
jgi:acetamidase/formamidase